MSKILAATCATGVVKVGALPVPGTEILSEGVGASDGLLLLDGDLKTYVAKTSPDLKSTITQAEAALTAAADALIQIATSLTTIGAVPSGWVTPPPTIAADVVIITTKAAAITAAKAALTALKVQLK